MNPLSIVQAAAVAVLASSCAATFEPAELTPAPQRPRISKNTKTTVKDSIEVEAGITWDPNDFLDTPVTAKYGVSEKTEVIAQSAILRKFETDFDDETGIGDLAFGVRHRFDDGGDGGAAFAFEFIGKLPLSDGGDEGKIGTGGLDPRTFIGAAANTGSTDLTIAGIVEQESGDMDIAGYAALNSFGSGIDGTIYQLLLASHVTTPLTEADTLFAEIAWALNETVNDTALVQAGIYRRVAANMTADAAVGIGLNADSPAFYIMLGLTTNFGYLR